MIYCKHCGKKLSDKGLGENSQSFTCKGCGAEVTPELADEEVRPLVQKLHKKSNFYRTKIDSGLSMIVIGGILLVIGLIFYYLAWKLDQSIKTERIYILNKSSSEYWVFVLGVGIGGLLVVAGLILAIVYAYLRREIVYDVEAIRTGKTAVCPPVPSIFAIWGRNISHYFKELSFQRQNRAAAKKEAQEYLKGDK